MRTKHKPKFPQVVRCKSCRPEGKNCAALRNSRERSLDVVAQHLRKPQCLKRPAKCQLLRMHFTYLLAVTASIVVLAGAGTAGPAKPRTVNAAARSPYAGLAAAV